MSIQFIRQDITKLEVDAIVNAANTTLLGGGGVDGCIHRAAGPELLEECKMLGGCDVGEAKITKSYNLPCKYIIHTVGPRWLGGTRNERGLLKTCYKNSLCLAKEYDCKTIAFPVISSGAYGYPWEDALRVADESISEFLNDNDMTVYIVIWGKETRTISEDRFWDIAKYIDDKQVENKIKKTGKYLNSKEVFKHSASAGLAGSLVDHCFSLSKSVLKKQHNKNLDEYIADCDESFQEMLLRKIDEKIDKKQFRNDADCYNKARIDRKLFSKIRKDKLYQPKKSTVILFAIALELSLNETNEMLEKAGYILSNSKKSDRIISFFIKNGIYDIFEINCALFEYEQKQLIA